MSNNSTLEEWKVELLRERDEAQKDADQVGVVLEKLRGNISVLDEKRNAAMASVAEQTDIQNIYLELMADAEAIISRIDLEILKGQPVHPIDPIEPETELPEVEEPEVVEPEEPEVDLPVDPEEPDNPELPVEGS